jgi:hypothetical protein
MRFKMKILQVISFFTSARGGSVIVPYHQSREISKRGHEVTIITTDFEFDELIAEKEGLRIINLGEMRMNGYQEKFKIQFCINKILIDRVSVLLFNSEILVKSVMDSPFTPLIYKVAGMLRTSEEREVVNEMRRHY